MAEFECVALKRLTKNDVSWLTPGSSSHQAGINLPKRAFIDLFEDISQIEENSPSKIFQASWFRQSGEEVWCGEIEIKFYNSKQEFRLINLPRSDNLAHLKVGHLLIFNRKQDAIRITPLSAGGEHLVRELGLKDLCELLPRRNINDRD